MPFVDNIIRYLQNQAGERIELVSDQQCTLFRPGGDSAPVPQKLSFSQISSMLNEVLPDEHRSRYAAGESFVFPYAFSGDTLDIAVSQEDGTVRVRIGKVLEQAEVAAAPAPQPGAVLLGGPPDVVEMEEGPRRTPEAPPPVAVAGGAVGNLSQVHIDDLLRMLVAREASDLHIRCGEPPVMRIHGKLVRTELPVMAPEDTKRLLYEILNEERRKRYEENWEMDLSHAIKGLARFRVNVFRQQGHVGAVLRVIPIKIKTIDELFLPPVTKKLCMMPRGLVLVTGPTGSGKSTSLAAMIDYINELKACHIVTIEDPIEFMHSDKVSVIEQRELGMDTHSFAEALKHVMRQNPDVILVGEMRDLETIQLAITAAETGHLVFATLHTTDAPQTCDRIIDVFTPEQQQQIRMQLSVTLQAVLSQTLLPRCDITGRIAAFEMMVATPAIRALIREGKTHQMYTDIQTGGEHGMQTLDKHLLSLVLERKVDYEEALAKASNAHDFATLAAKSGVAGARGAATVAG